MSGSSNKLEFRFGPYVPLVRSEQRIIVNANGVVDYYNETDLVAKKLLSEIFPGDSIVDAPSMVTPLLIKKRTIWPSVVDASSSTAQESSDNRQISSTDIPQPANNNDADDVRLIKIVGQCEVKCDAESHKLAQAKDYVRNAVVQKLSNNSTTTLSITNYFESSASDLLMSIGISQVTEFVLEDKHRMLTKKVKRGFVHLLDEESSTKSQLIATRSFNRAFKYDKIYRCSRCPYKSESAAVLDQHLEIPHKLNSRVFICSWCRFRTKEKNQIIFHTYMAHGKRSHVEKPIQTHTCRYCEFECNSKVKYSKHILNCERVFDKETVQALTDYDIYPAITPKLITKSDIMAYESVLKDLRLASFNPHQIEVTAHDSQNSIYLIPRRIVHLKSQVPQSSIAQLSSPFTSNPQGLSNKISTMPDSHPIVHSLLASGASATGVSMNKGVLMQHPKQISAFTNGIFAIKNAENVVMAPPITQQQGPTKHTKSISRPKKSTVIDSDHAQNSPIVLDDPDIGQEGSKGTNESFVICEICDTYIEGFSGFKAHMFDVHQVKIQSTLKSISRPPLNCQKCNWRFYTDQGLERHLLGSHGLVTTTMQAKAEKQNDSGRCTICGRKFSFGIVAHMRESHKIVPKAAQLSYKCRVCCATYGLYSHFENHVYRLHSDS